jgi:hypothetical protein
VLRIHFRVPGNSKGQTTSRVFEVSESYIGKRIKKSDKEKCRPQIELDLYHHFGIVKGLKLLRTSILERIIRVSSLDGAKLYDRLNQHLVETFLFIVCCCLPLLLHPSSIDFFFSQSIARIDNNKRKIVFVLFQALLY